MFFFNVSVRQHPGNRPKPTLSMIVQRSSDMSPSERRVHGRSRKKRKQVSVIAVADLGLSLHDLR